VFINASVHYADAVLIIIECLEQGWCQNEKNNPGTEKSFVMALK